MLFTQKRNFLVGLILLQLIRMHLLLIPLHVVQIEYYFIGRKNLNIEDIFNCIQMLNACFNFIIAYTTLNTYI